MNPEGGEKTMKLYPAHAMGIRAYCSDLIVDPEDLETVYFISLAGYQAAVKGIVANFLEHYGISVEIDGRQHLVTRASLGYKTLVKKLPSGLVQEVLFQKIALPKHDEESKDTFFVVTDRREDLLTLFFRHLDEKTDIPLHPSWDRWLWETFENEEGWMLEGKTLLGSYHGYLFEFSQTRLHDLISDAIKTRVPEVVGCMEWKGEKDNGKFDIA
jgi:hypothetical protein